MFATYLEEGMRDQSKFLEEICILVFSYDINDSGNDIKRKDGRHCEMLRVKDDLVQLLTFAEPRDCSDCSQAIT